jgi:hypothetical protein
MRHRNAVMTAASSTAVAAIMVGAAGAAASGPDRVVGAPAAALASCSGESCRGKVAAEQGCTADAYQVAGVEANATGGTSPYPHAILYYSPACDAAYGYYWSGNENEQRNVIVQTLYPYGGAPLPDDEIGYPTSGRNTFYTKMVPWGFSIRICVRGTGLSSDKCTGWR